MAEKALTTKLKSNVTRRNALAVTASAAMLAGVATQARPSPVLSREQRVFEILRQSVAEHDINGIRGLHGDYSAFNTSAVFHMSEEQLHELCVLFNSGKLIMRWHPEEAAEIATRYGIPYDLTGVKT